MTDRILSQSFTFLSRAYRVSPIAVRFSGAAILLIMVAHGTCAFASNAKGVATIPCGFNDSAFDPRTDVQAIRNISMLSPTC
jgi:hypothetical protein